MPQWQARGSTYFGLEHGDCRKTHFAQGTLASHHSYRTPQPRVKVGSSSASSRKSRRFFSLSLLVLVLDGLVPHFVRSQLYNIRRERDLPAIPSCLSTLSSPPLKKISFTLSLAPACQVFAHSLWGPGSSRVQPRRVVRRLRLSRRTGSFFSHASMRRSAYGCIRLCG